MPKYPHELLADLREKRVDEAAATLAKAATERAVAAKTRRMAEARRDAEDRMANGIRAAELEALASGRLRASDLARTDAWGIRVSAERAVLGAAIQRATEMEGEALRREAESQATVIARRADAKVVDEHRVRWDHAGRRLIAAREEEASAEAWRPKR